eukprot:475594-Rhodomonas_salina.1
MKRSPGAHAVEGSPESSFCLSVRLRAHRVTSAPSDADASKTYTRYISAAREAPTTEKLRTVLRHASASASSSAKRIPFPFPIPDLDRYVAKFWVSTWPLCPPKPNHGYLSQPRCPLAGCSLARKKFPRPCS